MVWEELAFKDFSIFSSGGLFVYRSNKILAVFPGSHLGNSPQKFESHWPKGLGGDGMLKQIIHAFIVLAPVAILFTRAELFSLFC